MSYDHINDEEQLTHLLTKSENFEERKKIRARLKEVRDIRNKEWEAKRLEREKNQEDIIKKKHREADLEKQKKLEAFATQAKEHSTQNPQHLDMAEKHLRERMAAADISKQRQLDMYDKLAGKEDGKTTTTTRRVETVTRVGGAGAGGRSAAKASPMNAFKAMDAKNNPTNQGGGKPMARSPSAIKTMLLEWTKAMTREYADKIQIENFSTSWNDGIAFCALIHHFYPDSFDFNSLDPKNRRKNFELAFDTAEKYADIAPLLDVEDMVRMKKPDWKCVFTYVQSFYRKLRDHENNKAK